MLWIEVCFYKSYDDNIEYCKNRQKSCEKTNIGCAIFQNYPGRVKNDNCI